MDTAAPVIVVTSLVTCYVTMPLLVFVHELGHAFAVHRTGRLALVVVGHQPPLLHRRLGWLELRVDPRLDLSQFHPRTDLRKVGRSGHLGRCIYDPRGLTVAQIRSIIRGGPIAAVFAGLAFAGFAYAIGPTSPILFWTLASAFVLSFVDAMVNLTPRRVAGHLSDGERMRLLMASDGARVPLRVPQGQAAPAQPESSRRHGSRR